MRVAWTRPALRDLETIGDYIARDNRRVADRIVERIRDQTRDLAQYPMIGRAGQKAVDYAPLIHPARTGADRPSDQLPSTSWRQS